jgi:tetratricopeptide (TPR) repeat protein
LRRINARNTALSASRQGDNTDATSPTSRRKLSVVLVSLLAALGIAVYVWTAPLRADRALVGAPLSRLEAAARDLPYSPRPHYLLGLRLFELGQLRLAEPELRRAADLDSDDEASWLGAGLAATAGNPNVGLGIVETFLQRHPNNARAHLTLAQIFTGMGAFARASDEAKGATRIDPNNSLAWRVVGEQQMLLRNMGDAEAAIRRSLDLDMGNAHSLMDLGEIYAAEDRMEEARAEYANAIRHAPADAVPLLEMGKLLLHHARTPDQLREARSYLTRSAAIQANNAEVCQEMARCSLKLGSARDAVTSLLRAHAFSPVDASIADDLMAAYRAEHDDRGAAWASSLRAKLLRYHQEESALTTKASADPRDISTLRSLAQLRAEHGDGIGALAAFGLLAARGTLTENDQQAESAAQRVAAGQSPAPTESTDACVLTPVFDPVALLLRDAEVLLAAGHTDRARTAYLTLVTRIPDLAPACEGLARIAESQGDEEQASIYYKRAVSLNPGLWCSQAGLGRYYGQSGRYPEATACYQLALKAVPKDAEMWHEYGTAIAEDPNSYREAGDAFAHAVASKPDDAAYWRDLAQAQAHLHDPAGAEASFRRALSLSPGDPQSNLALAAFLIDSRPQPAPLHEASQLLAGAQSVLAGNPIALYWQGRLALEQQDGVSAIRSLTQALHGIHREDAGQVWYALVRSYRMLGNATAEAHAERESERWRGINGQIDSLEDRLTRDPENPSYHASLARLYVQAGDTAPALKEYRRAAALNPADSQITRDYDRLTKGRS